MMYMTEEGALPAPGHLRPGDGRPRSMVATFYLGVLPTRVIDYALQSIQTIF